MITVKDIVGTAWTAITAAGQSGTAWLNELDPIQVSDDNIIVTHSNAGLPSAASNVGKRIFMPANNTDLLTIGADDAGDIYYAKCVTVTGKAKISVDVV